MRYIKNPRTRYDQRWPGFLMPPNPLTSFEIHTYQNEPKFNGLYSRSSLPKIKDGAYVINFDEYNSIESH